MGFAPIPSVVLEELHPETQERYLPVAKTEKTQVDSQNAVHSSNQPDKPMRPNGSALVAVPVKTAN